MAVERNRVVVIGAGIAGLVTAKVLRDDGFEVTVFEKASTVGGVWAESRTYPGLRANNSRDTYAYSDHPYDPSADRFPTADQVRRYLASYIRRFDIAPLIHLSTEVVRVDRQDTGFTIAVHGPAGPAEVHCDFVVIAAGTYSEPDMPEIAGAEHFTGKVVHSSQAADPALLSGRRVVVVGAGKSALDCAAWAAEHAERSTLVFRTPHWMMPRYTPGGLPMDRLVVGRIPELFIRYHRLTRVERFLHGPGRVVTGLFWRLIGGASRRLLRVPATMVPDRPMPHGFENLGFASEFYELAHRGRLDVRRDQITALGDGTRIRLASGDLLEADVVVLATGWRQSLSFLAPDLHAAVIRDGRFHLFRHILPPTEPRLGFVGYASSTACQLTSEISAHWLSHSFRGHLTLPDGEAMAAEIDRVHTWLTELFPRRSQGYFLGSHLIHHLDDLLTDMGLPTRRTRNTLAEYLIPFSPARYRDVPEQRRRASRSGAVGSSTRAGRATAGDPN